MPPDPRLRVAALLNASAGTIERQGAGTLRDVLASAFENHGIAAALEFLPGSGFGSAAERAREQVVDGKLDAIVVGGGDGSVRPVASVLAGSNIPLGILPLGTLNHFARDLGISVVAERAVAIIGAEEQRAVDVGEVNDVIFVNNSSIGFYPYLVLERERRRQRKRLSKWIAMILAMPRVLRNLPLFRLTILLSRAAARAYSSETMSIEFPDRGLARGRGSIEASCAFTSPRHKAGFRCSGSHAVAFSGLSGSSAIFASSRARLPISAHAGAGCSLRSMGKSQLCSRHSTTRSDGELCACSLRQ